MKIMCKNRDCQSMVKKMQLDVDVSPPAISLLVNMNPKCRILGQSQRDRRTEMEKK